jgi:hypothetical protein
MKNKHRTFLKELSKLMEKFNCSITAEHRYSEWSVGGLTTLTFNFTDLQEYIEFEKDLSPEKIKDKIFKDETH